MIFFIPIVMAAAAIASAASGAVAAARQSAANAKVAQQIGKQIELEKESYELLKKQRNMEKSNTFFQFQNEADQYRLQTRSAIQQTRLQDKANIMQLAQTELEVNKAEFQNEQNREVQKQEQAQTEQQAYEGVNQALQSAGESEAKLAQSMADTTKATGQQGTRSIGAQRERLGLAGQTLAQSKTTMLNQVAGNIDQDRAINTRLFDLQHAATEATTSLQDELAQVEFSANEKILQGNRDTLNAQHRLFKIGLRANKIAERKRQQAQRATDQISHETNISKLNAAMPSSSSADMLGSIIGGISNIAGAVAPLFSGGGGVSSSSGAQTSQFGLSNAISLSSASNITSLPTNASYKLGSGTYFATDQGAAMNALRSSTIPSSRINFYPPSVPSSRITSYPPQTTNGNDFPSMTRIFS